MLVGIAAILVLVLFVLPRFSDLLLSSGTALPATTASVVGVAMAAREHWWILAAVQPPLMVASRLAPDHGAEAGGQEPSAF